MNRIAIACSSTFVLMLATAVSAQQAAAGGRRGAVPAQAGQNPLATGGPQGFSVVLVTGEMATSTSADSVPPAARKALLDMKDFLPFKSYRLLDVQWTLCCGQSPVASRLRGADDQDYELELAPSTTDTAGKIYVRFTLREATDTPFARASATAAAATAQRRIAEARLAEARSRYNDTHPSVLEAQKEVTLAEKELQAAAAAERSDTVRSREFAQRGLTPARPGRPIIETSFTMDVGETVVVGTSRLKGADKALIALLTAVPPRK